MEFGKITHIEDVPWDLPSEDPLTLAYLEKIKKTSSVPAAEFFLGTPAWGHREWIGKIYPPGTKPADFLKFYAENFRTIELNTTHYRIPGADQVQRWRAQVGADFVFCPKVFQSISHTEAGLLDKSLLHEWYGFLKNMQGALGPCFLQFPPHFDYSKKALLFHFLQQWPDEFQLALEFRHPSWFRNGQIIPALTTYLQSRDIGLVITDVAGRRDVLHSSVSAPFTMIRLIGNSLHPSDYTRAKGWVQRLHHWSDLGLQKIYFFLHQPDDIKGPEFASYVIQEINEESGAGLDSLKWCL